MDFYLEIALIILIVAIFYGVRRRIKGKKKGPATFLNAIDSVQEDMKKRRRDAKDPVLKQAKADLEKIRKDIEQRSGRG